MNALLVFSGVNLGKFSGLFSCRSDLPVAIKVLISRPGNQRYECHLGIPPNQRRIRVWYSSGRSYRM